MLLTERPHNGSNTDFVSKCDVQIRLLGGGRDQEIIPLALGNHAVGSGPKCQVRLLDAGVGPMHCLIVHNDTGVRVRRWSGGTLLNGQTFHEAPLTGGDCLSIGPIDLEIVTRRSVAEALPATESLRDDELAPEAEVVEDIEIALDELAWDAAASGVLPFDAANSCDDSTDESIPENTDQPAEPGIGAAILSALECQRQHFDELFARVDELEQKVESALAERDEVNFDLVPQRSSAAKMATDDVDRDSSLLVERWNDREESTDARAWSDWTQERDELVAHSANLEADLSLAQQQLADALTELGEAQLTIDNLQARLAKSEQAMEELSEEHAAWQEQLAELERQLTTYAAQADELQHQLLRSQQSAQPTVEPAVAVADPYEVESLPAWESRAASDVEQAAIEEEPAAEDIWAAVESARSISATAVGGYDWSAHSPSEKDEAAGMNPGEVATAAEAAWPTSMPWTNCDSPDVADNNSIEPTAAAIQPAVDAVVETFHVEETPPVEMPPPPATAKSKKKESDSRLSEEVRAALAQFRELSLWRQIPESSETDADADDDELDHRDGIWQDEDVAESNVAEKSADAEWTLPAVEAEAASEVVSSQPEVEPPVESLPEPPVVETKSSAPEPTSFIERYSSMFADEERSTESSVPASVVAPALTLEEIMGRAPEQETPAVIVAVPIGTASEAGDTDESMEHYMARMMQRIRGDSPAVPASQSVRAVESSERKSILDPLAAIGSRNQSAARSATSQPSSAGDGQNAKSLISLEELKRKEPTPEFTTDMGALRALANQTARHAIGVHTTRTLRRSAVTRFIICLLAGTTCFYFMIGAPAWDSLEFSIGCVALIAGIYWGRLTFVALIKAVRVGAFDDLGSEFAPVESSNPPLPIDIQRR